MNVAFSVACNPTDPVLLSRKKKKDESLTAHVSYGVSLIKSHESLKIDLCRIFKLGNSQVYHFANNSVMA